MMSCYLSHELVIKHSTAPPRHKPAVNGSSTAYRVQQHSKTRFTNPIAPPLQYSSRKMGFCSSVASNDTNSRQQPTMKRVRFKPYASLIKVPHPDAAVMEEEDTDESSSSSSSSWGLWYSKEEMSSLARADVNALVASHRSSTAAAVADDSDDMDCDPQTEQQPQVCGRGLEMYLPGQLVLLRRRRKAYQEAALRKYRALLALCRGKGRDEIAKRLEQFLTIRSRESVDHAHALGVQDATDAQAIHQESNHCTTTTNSGSSTTTFIGNKRKALFSCDEHMATSSKSAVTCPLSPSSSTLMTKQVVLTPNSLFSHQAIQRVA